MSFARSPRMLLLGSNRVIVHHSSRFLQEEGDEVEVSTFPSITVQEIERLRPALILIDLTADQQREQQAWLLMRQVEASSATRTVFLICTATLARRAYRAYLYEKDIPLLFKPFEGKELGRRVRQLLA